MVAAGQGGSFSLHPRRPWLRGGVKSEIILILVSRAASQPPSVSAPACGNGWGATFPRCLCGLLRVNCQKSLAGVPAPFPTRRAPGWCGVRQGANWIL